MLEHLNPDGILATEGGNALQSFLEEDTINLREASTNNPIQMDVVGELTSINRDFKEVVNLMRLLQQDFGAKANVPAPLIWSYGKVLFLQGMIPKVNCLNSGKLQSICTKMLRYSLNRLL